MEITRFQPERDLERLTAFLRAQYNAHRNADSWLPERLHDLFYRVGAFETDEGRPRSSDYIFLWEDGAEIVACLLPDGENVYVSIKDGFDALFPSMLAYSEAHCLPLFARQADGSVKFWVAVSDSMTRMQATLEASGYSRFAEKEYRNSVDPRSADWAIRLPSGFRFLYGDACPDEENKWSALCLGFHPEREAPDYRASMNPYHARKRSSLYADSFECVVIDENTAARNNVCAYCFVYVDRQTKTAQIEPVSTREQYRSKGLGTAMMHGALQRCREQGIEKCYVDSFGQRKDFYSAAGFSVERSISFWYKTLCAASEDRGAGA